MFRNKEILHQILENINRYCFILINSTSIFMFADDTNVVITADSHEKFCENTNKVLDSVSKWLCLNRISINPKRYLALYIL